MDVGMMMLFASYGWKNLSAMIVRALRNGCMEGDGTFYTQPKIDIRPQPKYPFEGRIYAMASSENSVASAARLGARMVMFSDRPWPRRVPAITQYRALFQQGHGGPVPPLMITNFCLCGPSLSETEEHARRYMGKFVESNFHHYEFLGDYFAQVKGYDAYAPKTAIAKPGGLDGPTGRGCRSRAFMSSLSKMLSNSDAWENPTCDSTAK